MQFFNILQTLGIIILLVGVILIFVGMLSSKSSDSYDSQSETRGVVLLGPIPIVIGASRQTQVILCVIGIAICIIIFLLFQL